MPKTKIKRDDRFEMKNGRALAMTLGSGSKTYAEANVTSDGERTTRSVFLSGPPTRALTLGEAVTYAHLILEAASVAEDLPLPDVEFDDATETK